MRAALHLVLHLVVPGVLARVIWKGQWRRAWGIMALTMVIDLDHLLATPIYEPSRCSIGTHPLHSVWVIALCMALFALPRGRLVATGLTVHWLLDALDCWLMLLP